MNSESPLVVPSIRPEPGFYYHYKHDPIRGVTVANIPRTIVAMSTHTSLFTGRYTDLRYIMLVNSTT